MRVKVLKIRISDRYQNLDEAAMNDFLQRYDVVNINAKMNQEESTYWSILIYYQEKIKKANSNKISVNSEADLSSDQIIVYNKLKEWRSEKAKEAHIPSYMIFHNTHLMSIVKHHPYKLEDLEEISGLGEYKIKRYGHEILEVLDNA